MDEGCTKCRKELGPPCNQIGGTNYPISVFGMMVTSDRLPTCFQPYKVNVSSFVKRQMIQLTNRESGQCARWCALVVLLAVCSLAVSVATRYGSSGSATSGSKVAQAHSCHEPGRQRLTTDADSWMPPVIASNHLYTPSEYPPFISGGPRFLNRFVESSLYNRPPPSLSSL